MNPERRNKGLYWDRAWKLVEGCARVSAGCDNCWSEQQTVMRCGHPHEAIRERARSAVHLAQIPGDKTRFDGRVHLRHDNLDLPLRTKKPMVWAVWNDLWHEEVPLEFITRAFQVMERARKLGHVFLVLTKRAERMGGFLSEVAVEAPDHIWFGVSVEDQPMADERIPHLSQIPGNRFVSIEPMLGPIDLYRGGFSFLHDLKSPQGKRYGKIHQVLLGGESGKDARPMNPLWARTIRDQCQDAGVPFYHKQNGEWASVSAIEGPGKHHYFPTGETVRRAGKKKAGRLLDGRLHDDLAWDNL